MPLPPCARPWSASWARPLADPEKISTATVQDIKRCLDLVAELETSLPKESEAEESRKRGLSGNMAQDIYQALGITGE